MSLSAGHEQVEQNRASPLLVHSLNWKGRPLLSFEAVVNLIDATTTKSGLKVKAVLDTTACEPGEKIDEDKMRMLALKPHRFHGDWNYTPRPRLTA